MGINPPQTRPYPQLMIGRWVCQPTPPSKCNNPPRLCGFNTFAFFRWTKATPMSTWPPHAVGRRHVQERLQGVVCHRRRLRHAACRAVELRRSCRPASCCLCLGTIATASCSPTAGATTCCMCSTTHMMPCSGASVLAATHRARQAAMDVMCASLHKHQA
jgi:hypothetical protein